MVQRTFKNTFQTDLMIDDDNNAAVSFKGLLQVLLDRYVDDHSSNVSGSRCSSSSVNEHVFLLL